MLLLVQYSFFKEGAFMPSAPDMMIDKRFDGSYDIASVREHCLKGTMTKEFAKGYMLQSLVLTAIFAQYGTHAHLIPTNRPFEDGHKGTSKDIFRCLNECLQSNHRTMHGICDPAIAYLRANIERFISGQWTEGDVHQMFGMNEPLFEKFFPFPWNVKDNCLVLFLVKDGKPVPVTKDMKADYLQKCDIQVRLSTALSKEEVQKMTASYVGWSKPAHGEALPLKVWQKQIDTAMKENGLVKMITMLMPWFCDTQIREI